METTGPKPPKIQKVEEISNTLQEELVKPILHRKYTRDVEFVTVLTAKISDPKECQRLIPWLREKFPMPELSHLKRISSKVSATKEKHLEVILWHQCDSKGTAIVKTALEEGDLLACVCDFKQTEVASTLPLTRAQYCIASSKWPTAFHEDKRISSLQNGTYFSKLEISRIKRYMALAVEKVHASVELPIGYCIVDPVSDELIACGHDLRSQGEQLHHASMVAVDMVAYAQGGGALSIPYVTTGEHGGNTITLPDNPTSDATSVSSRCHANNGYLCTGLDLYVTIEPCIMCAMALVHCRIGRVFYGAENNVDGGLGSRCSIHTLENLNHHFPVFKYVGQSECSKI